jgi:calcineurin-like phosphoesterase family protein
MSNIFLASDHHLGHANIITFKDRNDSIIRNFNSIEEHDEHIIEQHNKVVGISDRIYYLGDVLFSKKHLHLLSRMQGRKVLIKGNHDKLDLKDYLPYFDDIRGSHQLSGMVLTHIPVHPDSLSRWSFNIHGHLHQNNVMLPSGELDNRYFNVSLEQINYTPISLEGIKCKLGL